MLVSAAKWDSLDSEISIFRKFLCNMKDSQGGQERNRDGLGASSPWTTATLPLRYAQIRVARISSIVYIAPYRVEEIRMSQRVGKSRSVVFRVPTRFSLPQNPTR